MRLHGGPLVQETGLHSANDHCLLTSREAPVQMPTDSRWQVKYSDEKRCPPEPSPA